MIKERKCGVCIYTMEYYPGLTKEILPFANNMIESKRYYAKWNKPKDAERKKLLDLTYTPDLKKSNI